MKMIDYMPLAREMAKKFSFILGSCYNDGKVKNEKDIQDAYKKEEQDGNLDLIKNAIGDHSFNHFKWGMTGNKPKAIKDAEDIKR
jgi:hypothetical protein